jgi:hypothetical protein
MTIFVAVIVAIVVLVGALFGRHGLPELKRYMKIRKM